MIVQRVTEALRPAFKKMTDEVTEAILTGKTGQWHIMNGLPMGASISIMWAGPNTSISIPMQRFFNSSRPYVFGGRVATITESHQIESAKLEESVQKTIDGIRDMGPKMMAGTLVHCFSKILQEGIDHDLMIDIISHVVVADVIDG